MLQCCTMTREEYEQRQRRLDEQLESGIELLRSAHRQQMRALDLVGMTTAEEDVAIPQRPAKAPAERPPAAETKPTASSPPAPPPPAPPRRTASHLAVEIRKALSRLPQQFDRNDILKALGYEADRASLYRAMQYLVQDQVIVQETYATGKIPTRYRKLGKGAAAAAPKAPATPTPTG
jgi:hypothetical protein